MLAAYRLLSEDANFLMNIYRLHTSLLSQMLHVCIQTLGRSDFMVLRQSIACRRLKLSYYQYEVSSVCYMLQVTLVIIISFLLSSRCALESLSVSTAM